MLESAALGWEVNVSEVSYFNSLFYFAPNHQLKPLILIELRIH